MRMVLLVVLVAFGWTSSLADEPLSPQARYKIAVGQMRDLPEPPYIRYRIVLPKGDSSMTIVRLPDGRSKLVIQIGRPPYARASWDVAYRSRDGVAAVATDAGGEVASTQGLFDPTWHGAYRWLRYGLLASTQSPPPASPGATLAATPAINSKSSPWSQPLTAGRIASRMPGRIVAGAVRRIGSTWSHCANPMPIRCVGSSSTMRAGDSA